MWKQSFTGVGSAFKKLKGYKNVKSDGMGIKKKKRIGRGVGASSANIGNICSMLIENYSKTLFVQPETGVGYQSFLL